MDRKGGPTPKGALISENFNPFKKEGLNKKEIQIVKKVSRLKVKEDCEERRLLRLSEQESVRDAKDEKSAYQMLQDMRWVYRKLKGRNKLKGLVKEDDKQFVFMIKELMKIETALLSAKIRAKETIDGSGGDRMVFVVLKGLEDEAKIKDVIGKDVDILQISHAINPDGSDYKREEG